MTAVNLRPGDLLAKLAAPLQHDQIGNFGLEVDRLIEFPEGADTLQVVVSNERLTISHPRETEFTERPEWLTEPVTKWELDLKRPQPSKQLAGTYIWADGHDQPIATLDPDLQPDRKRIWLTWQGEVKPGDALVIGREPVIVEHAKGTPQFRTVRNDHGRAVRRRAFLVNVRDRIRGERDQPTGSPMVWAPTRPVLLDVAAGLEAALYGGSTSRDGELHLRSQSEIPPGQLVRIHSGTAVENVWAVQLMPLADGSGASLAPYGLATDIPSPTSFAVFNQWPIPSGTWVLRWHSVVAGEAEALLDSTQSAVRQLGAATRNADPFVRPKA